jgi:hypothetical protein
LEEKRYGIWMQFGAVWLTVRVIKRSGALASTEVSYDHIVEDSGRPSAILHSSSISSFQRLPKRFNEAPETVKGSTLPSGMVSDSQRAPQVYDDL